MAEAIFTYNSQDIVISCDKNQKMKDICTNLSNIINIEINSLIFLYGDTKLNLEKTFEETTKENRISIIVEVICPKCGGILNNEIINEIISSNNKINFFLKGIKSQIQLIMTDILTNVDINNIISRLKNINIFINNTNIDIKYINNKLNVIKLNDNNIIELNKHNKVEKIIKNEITCIYNKEEDQIDILHDYIFDYSDNENNKLYIEGKNNINDNNIDIYINNKKIKFNYKYKSNEKGNIQVKFIFNKLLTSTNSMFRGCSSLQFINLSSFNNINVKDMRCMFSGCSSLKSIDLSSLNTTNVNDMSYMFSGCSSLESLDLSSFNTINVNYMNNMFQFCSSLKSINLSSFNIANVKDMRLMFDGCSMDILL